MTGRKLPKLTAGQRTEIVLGWWQGLTAEQQRGVIAGVVVGAVDGEVLLGYAFAAKEVEMASRVVGMGQWLTAMEKGHE